MKIAYLGPKNSYSHIAAQKFLNDSDILCEYPTITHALLSVGNECGAAVVPYENSSEGSISDTIDMLIARDGLYINLEYRFNIENRLIALEKADFKNVKKIYTHKQPYGQCREKLSKLYPKAEIVFTDSTSAAAALVTDNFTAAIGGIQLAVSGLKASDFVLNDFQHNRTRFVLITDKPSEAADNDRTTLVFESENKPGGLLSLLKVFDNYGINMTKIESRPRKDIIGRYLFIADIAGGAQDINVAEALNELSKNTVYYKNLGSYKLF